MFVSSVSCCLGRSVVGAYFGRRGVFAILLVSYDLRCVALPPLEIVQCLRDSFRLFLPYRWYHTTSFVPVSSFCLCSTPLFVVRVVGALASLDAG